MALHRDLGITQKTAWFRAQRLRTSMFRDGRPFSGPVEVDGTYMGGKRKNMPKSKREEMTGRGAVGKTAVVGAKDRASNKVTAKAVTSTDKETLLGLGRIARKGPSCLRTPLRFGSSSQDAHDGRPESACFPVRMHWAPREHQGMHPASHRLQTTPRRIHGQP